MSMWYDSARKRWRYDFQINKVRYAGIVIDPVLKTPVQQKTEAKMIVQGLRVAAAKRTPEEKPTPGAYTLGMAMNAVAADVEGKSEESKYNKYIREFLEFYGPTTPIAEITKMRIQDYINWALKQKIGVYVGGPRQQDSEERKVKKGERSRAANTVKRYLNALHKAFDIANATIDPVTQIPFLPRIPEFPSVATIKRIPRPPEDSLLIKMLAAAPSHLRDAILLSILIGFRKSELFENLEIDQVDFERHGIWMDGEHTKGQRDEFMPANEAAMEILTRLVKQSRKEGQTRLILYYPPKPKKGVAPPPRPIKDSRTAWRTLRKKFGIEKRHRFHDLRAAYITALAYQASPRVVQELARHKSMATTQMYIKIADPAQRSAVEAIGVNRGIIGGFSADVNKESQTRSPKQKRVSAIKAA